MIKCSFCGDNVKPGTGLMFVKNDGTIYTFCTRKCEVALLKHGRKPRTTRWTAAFAKEKEMLKHAEKK